jgi:hypothetical protein
MYCRSLWSRVPVIKQFILAFEITIGQMSHRLYWIAMQTVKKLAGTFRLYQTLPVTLIGAQGHTAQLLE